MFEELLPKRHTCRTWLVQFFMFEGPSLTKHKRSGAAKKIEEWMALRRRSVDLCTLLAGCGAHCQSAPAMGMAYAVPEDGESPLRGSCACIVLANAPAMG